MLEVEHAKHLFEVHVAGGRVLVAGGWWPSIKPSIGDRSPNTRPNLELLKATITHWMEKQYVQQVCASFRACVGKVMEAGGYCIE